MVGLELDTFGVKVQVLSSYRQTCIFRFLFLTVSSPMMECFAVLHMSMLNSCRLSVNYDLLLSRLKFRAVKHSDAGRYGCCIKMENGTEQWRNITLMVYDTIAHEDFLQDVAAAHVPSVIERQEDLPAAGDSYNYETDPGRRLNDADMMLRGGKLYCVNYYTQK